MFLVISCFIKNIRIFSNIKSFNYHIEFFSYCYIMDCSESEPREDIPLIIKKNSIKNRANELTYEDRLYVLQILKQHLPPTKIIENADGCRINLDTLNIEIINKIHHIIDMRLKIPYNNKI